MRFNASAVFAGAVLASCFALSHQSGALQAAPVGMNYSLLARMNLDQKIAYYARHYMGQKVGDGECTSLISDIFTRVGARPMTYETWSVVENGAVKRIESYSWGQRFVALGKGSKPIAPKVGNIIQFEGCVFNGGGSKFEMLHHSAIVDSVSGSVITLLHQNGEGDINLSKVRRDAVDLKTLKSGTYRVYSAVRR